MERQLQFILEFIRLPNNRSLMAYWNLCVTEFSKLNKFTHVH